MNMRKISVAAAVLLIISLLTAPLSSLAGPNSNQTTGSQFLKNIKVSGELEDGGTFDGMLSITELNYDEAEGLVMSGNLRGKAVNADGEKNNIRESLTDVPVNLTDGEEVNGNAFQSAALGTAQEDGCDILFLDVGPIFLDLLGLELDLSQIELDLTAVPGPGNLLGNLLCAVTGLLDGNGFLSGIIDGVEGILDGLLGQINDIL